MNHRRRISTPALILGVLAALTVIACGGTSEDTAAGPDTSPAVDAANRPGWVGEPDAATTAAYVADLDAIDTDIVHGKADKAVSRGRSQCSSIYEFPKDRAKLVDYVEKRFISPDAPGGHGKAKSEKILNVVHKHLCPEFPLPKS
ncbi:hypothetical protein [Melissospora conviva]|uniref:hypothetical protein n=1 Tax=Melissospora conviva TaxID=3388432 RepID=UPI003C1AC650